MVKPGKHTKEAEATRPHYKVPSHATWSSWSELLGTTDQKNDGVTTRLPVLV